MSDAEDFAAFQAWKASGSPAAVGSLAPERPALTFRDVLKALVSRVGFASEQMVADAHVAVDDFLDTLEDQVKSLESTGTPAVEVATPTAAPVVTGETTAPPVNPTAPVFSAPVATVPR